MSASIKSGDPDPVFIIRSGHESVSVVKFCCLGENKEEVLISGTQHGLVQVWDLITKRVKFKFQVNSGLLYLDVILLKEIDYIVSHDRKGKVVFWQVSNNDVVMKKSTNVHHVGFCPLHIFKQDDVYWMVYPSSEESEFSVTKANLDSTDQDVYVLKPKENLGMVMHVKLCSKQNTLFAVAGYEDGSVYVWNVFTSRCHGKRIHTDPVMCLTVDCVGEKILTGSADNKLVVSKINSDVQFEEHVTDETKTSGYSSCDVRNDGRIVACGGWDGKIRIFGWKKLKRLAILKYHSESVNCLHFGANRLLAAGSKDGKITLWDVYK